ncbi:histidine phosphatase family protein [Sulfitobacter sp. F26169L]|uniref:histidine phosphatase family protein n=1 Tax=Sulfitobacter sp. F26169L TaxID=2996015 RepID=UPI002260ECEB|nr:histidine phosphatase family protein [Sulfitobacter sp. F26169L]MCX7567442.1 histidine phosphatase family protein [Sulfitobacter sp. F26169L]
MAELLVIRHGQASFGAADYDVLSELGRAQSRAAGDWLRLMGWEPDRVVTGTLNRQIDTAAEMGFASAREEHAGLNEYDFGDLLTARFKGDIPEMVKGDRKTHFRTLRETVFAWQKDEIENPYETWGDFAARIEAARAFAVDTDAKRVLVVSSGGVIGQLAAVSLQAPVQHMMHLNLQIKNAAMTRFIFSGNLFSLSEFNATPHFATPDGAKLMSYS